MRLESSCLAICSPLYVIVFLYSLAKKLALSPMVSAMSGVYRDGLVLGLYAPCPGFQPL